MTLSRPARLPLGLPVGWIRRATIRIDEVEGLPTAGAIQANASELASYALISQAAGLMPIVEPEILVEGSHGPELFAEVRCSCCDRSWRCLDGGCNGGVEQTPGPEACFGSEGPRCRGTVGRFSGG